jgi:hypothetical protein
MPSRSVRECPKAPRWPALGRWVQPMPDDVPRQAAGRRMSDLRQPTGIVPPRLAGGEHASPVRASEGRDCSLDEVKTMHLHKARRSRPVRSAGSVGLSWRLACL